jgi:hypothetical protein
MSLKSPGWLALAMNCEATRWGGATSARLSNVRAAIRGTLRYGWGPFNAEPGSITKFAHDYGFEYLGVTGRIGQEVCNFWLIDARAT